MELVGLFFVLFILVGAPCIANVVLIFCKPLTEKKRYFILAAELFSIFVGAYCTILMSEPIMYKDWFEQLYNDELHSPIYLESLPTFWTLAAITLTGHICLRVMNVQKMPPLLAVLCMSGLYLGIAECVLWGVQIAEHLNPWLYVLPANLVIIFLRSIRDVVCLRIRSEGEQAPSQHPISRLLHNARHWPWMALVLAAPLLGVAVMILTLFGQKPDDIIKMWTETADWTMSTKIPPQNIFRDEHYLCTVAAGGHRKVVKPLRVGLRHGHRVVVNRQLMIANAFEQLLEERLPRFHRVIRNTYDKTGYPIARHIHSPYVADLIYFIMKPLEWCFLAVLYLCDPKPENRIAVQYPHSPPPKV